MQLLHHPLAPTEAGYVSSNQTKQNHAKRDKKDKSVGRVKIVTRAAQSQCLCGVCH